MTTDPPGLKEAAEALLKDADGLHASDGRKVVFLRVHTGRIDDLRAALVAEKSVEPECEHSDKSILATGVRCVNCDRIALSTEVTR